MWLALLRPHLQSHSHTTGPVDQLQLLHLYVIFLFQPDTHPSYTPRLPC